MVAKPNLGIGPMPLWLVEPEPEPEFDFVPLGPLVASHIQGQQEAIELLGQILSRIVTALDLGKVHQARELAAEAVDELTRSLTRH